MIFWPHFVGMDAGVDRADAATPRPFIGIYTRQSNPVVDAWVLQGRHRFGNVRLLSRTDGVRRWSARCARACRCTCCPT
jgi:KDO2-lipid IV(A) lauroyltransferase